MKRLATLKTGFILLTALTASISGFAANTNSTSLHLTTPTRVGTSDLPAGDYRLTWSDPASPDTSTQVSFAQGRKVVATVPAKIVRAQNNTDSLETNSQSGATVLDQIHIAHFNIAFDSTTTAQR